MAQFSILIETNRSGFLATCPELEDYQIQGESIDFILDQLKAKLKNHFTTQTATEARNSRPIWELAQEITSDMTEEEIAQLPIDGSEQHDHYIYGIPKRNP